MRLEKKKGPLQNRMSHIFFNMNMRDPVLQWSIFCLLVKLYKKQDCSVG